MLIRIFEILFPVFAVAAVGYIYGRLRAPDMRVATELNMNLFVPALIFSALAGSDFKPEAYAMLAIIGSGLLALTFLYLVKMGYRTFILPVMSNNFGNMRLSLALP